ncbi:unnamed protein product [Polarella glacialis]|uniref:RNA-editing substrate-binding complex 6 protein domain-containing protein n=1 Tax=Polarella glacialis TaxID=89957 RepID=A0A813DHF9_POLGL|nr:unnamed protein product [Polarella glacialis]CAE8680719.1 unnamed protein product [Polarella glacialis]
MPTRPSMLGKCRAQARRSVVVPSLVSCERRLAGPCACAQPARALSSQVSGPAAPTEKKPWRSLLRSDPSQQGNASNNSNSNKRLGQAAVNGRLHGALDMEEVLCLWQELGATSFDAVNLASAIRAAALLPNSNNDNDSDNFAARGREKTSCATALGEDARWRALLQAAEGRLREFRPRDLAGVVWALARADAGEELLRAICTEMDVAGWLQQLTSRDFALAAWAFAKAGLGDAPLLEAMQLEAAKRLGEFSSQDVVNVAWAFAKMQSQQEPLMRQLADRAAERLQDLHPQDLANTAWAFAKAGLRHEELMSGIAALTVVRISEFNAQELSSIIWAFAWTEIGLSPALSQLLVDRSIALVLSFNAQGLARIAWSFAKMDERRSSELLMATIASRATEQIKSFSAANLAKLAWAFAKVDERAEALMHAVALRALDILQEFNARDLGMIAWALAKADVIHVPLMRAIAAQAAKNSVVQEFTTQGLANTAAAFAMSSVRDDALMQAIAETSLQRMDEFPAQGLVDLQWAFETLEVTNDVLQAAIAKAPGWAERPVYEHRFHAGSIADCFKHVVLVMLLQSAVQESTSFRYVDTHSGGGLYDLPAVQQGRCQEGILRLAARAAGAEDLPWPIAEFLAAVGECNPRQDSSQVDAAGGRFQYYPGSPALALRWLRPSKPQDGATLFEASAPVHAALCKSLDGNTDAEAETKLQILHEDAYRGLRRISSFAEERVFFFIDPPYELSFSDNLNMALLSHLSSRWPGSTVALWYPIRDDSRTDRVYRRVRSLGLGPVLAAEFEVGRRQASESLSSVRTGMLIVHPPEHMERDLKGVLPQLARLLAPDAKAPVSSSVFWL